jgi:hypothetical protein
MMCKLCSDQLGLPAVWHAHAQLERPGSVRTIGYSATAQQKLYACKSCDAVLRKGRNTGWTLAARPDSAAASSPPPGAS